MKNLFLTIVLLFSIGVCSAQWTTLNSGTVMHLHDVDFLDVDYGVAVGDAGTVLLTVDGGQNWNSINSQLTLDIYSVEILNYDTIVISDFDQNSVTGHVYITYNSGGLWTSIATDAATNHHLDLQLNPVTGLFGIGANLVSTNNNGASWDTLANYTAGTLSLDQLTFAGSQVGYASGLQSGFTTYSAAFYRTDDGGANWYPADPFSFLNADALTAMSFINADTAMMFTNHYAGFMPGTQNGLMMLRNFYFITPFPPDTVVVFSSHLINSNMPSWINDGHFSGTMTGFAAAQDGNMYKTINGGVTWTIDYTTGASLNKMSWIDATGYAVGNGGTIIKNDSTATAIYKNEGSGDIAVYPNPANDEITIETNSFLEEEKLTAEIYDLTGKMIEQFYLEEEVTLHNINTLSPGIYMLKVSDELDNSYYLKWAKQ